MRFKDVFSIIGPAMVGPSSSHTAGAARIGRSARHLLGAPPAKADVAFYGSFAATYAGHGTDVAIIGGILDFLTDDPRIPDAIRLAEEIGIEVNFREGRGLYPHPNTARVKLVSAAGESIEAVGISIGGGNIEIVEINGFRVKMTAIYPTLVLFHADLPGVIADITGELKEEHSNIGYMSVDRKSRSGDALTVIELDTEITTDMLNQLGKVHAIQSIRVVDITDKFSMVKKLQSPEEGPKGAEENEVSPSE
ncbi:L-serine ammonia-lyase, iron-sulfur-dependent, subunit beta [Paenibacillus sp. 1011MAR3C5]|uniref:L-serine ammonia-lyase, iron-sulfur-dependent subunit beta n=1 Tax=Paenibacillus sp. 1011MAR3C5 TaxID=1675787 RepID=UPI000E6CAFB2|nr:L-serine ammonia-lyase, iron-sulfur-dependent subunit beta [Paenibacillus sp. 1011MAR3C5]RJE85558.1 L-serine ammonia-lyase, iron-sulfur-dependent, subunit beta [Paenibacillus sp. 1011MAR3C5]